MISSIFGKTKPANFVILLGFLIVLYWGTQIFLLHKSYELTVVLVDMLALAALGLSLFLVDFMAKKNKLTGPSSYAILFYTLLILLFPESLGDNLSIFSNVFLLLAFRKMLSLKSQKNIKLKIFDATLWIMIASIFYKWAVLYLLVLFLAIAYYQAKNIRAWLSPLPAILSFFLILFGISILLGQQAFISEHYAFTVALSDIQAFQWANSLKLLIYIFVNAILAFINFIKIGKAGVGRIINFRLLLFIFVFGLLIGLPNGAHGHYTIIYTFFPSAIFMTNYVESIKKDNIKEVVLILSLLFPVIIYFTKLTIQ